jgi:hypothetical protein
MAQLHRGHFDAGDRLPQRHQDLPMRPAGHGTIRAACPACRRVGLQTMAFRLRDGGTAEMRRCIRCEWKAWWLGDRQVALADLLDAVSTAGLPHAPRRRTAS